jgi:hypothetical protein
LENHLGAGVPERQKNRFCGLRKARVGVLRCPHHSSTLEKKGLFGRGDTGDIGDTPFGPFVYKRISSGKSAKTHLFSTDCVRARLGWKWCHRCHPKEFKEAKACSQIPQRRFASAFADMSRFRSHKEHVALFLRSLRVFVGDVGCALR